MDKSKAHDLLHMWNGGKSENCPVCNGTCSSDEEIISRAMHLAAEIAKPTIDPQVPIDKVVFASEEGKIDETTTPPVETTEQPQEEGKKEEAKEVKASQKKGKKLSVMTDVMSFAEGNGVPAKIKIIPSGKFNTPKYGELEISRSCLEEMRRNFYEDVRASSSKTGLPIDIEHGETAHRDAAAGWMKDVEVYDDGMYAKVEWTPLGEDLLSKGLYKFFSPEFTFDYVSNEESTYFANVVTGGGLVNKPLFDHSLPPVMFSEGENAQNLTAESTTHTIFITNMQSSADVATDNHNASVLEVSKKGNTMDLQAILAKDKATRTSEEQAFIAANRESLTAEQLKAEGFVASEESAAPQEEAKTEGAAAPAEETKVEEKVEAPAESAPVETAPAAPEAPAQPTEVTASEKKETVVVTASEYSKMKEELESFKAAAERSKKELEKNSITEQVKAFTFSEKGGKIAPAQVEPIVNLALKMGEAERAELFSIIGSLPDRGQMLFSENGSDQDITASQAVDARIAELKSSGMSFSDALKTVSQENPEGFKAYQAASLQPVAR